MVQALIVRYAGRTACTRVDQFEDPAITCALPETTGLTALTPEIAAMAVASLAFSVLLLAAPDETPPFRVLPGEMVSTLTPSPASCPASCALAPSPRATMAITAAASGGA